VRLALASANLLGHDASQLGGLDDVVVTQAPKT